MVKSEVCFLKRRHQGTPVSGHSRQSESGVNGTLSVNGTLTMIQRNPPVIQRNLPLTQRNPPVIQRNFPVQQRTDEARNKRMQVELLENEGNKNGELKEEH